MLDFGIAKVLSEDTTDLTGTGAAIGSLAYMSPEQIDGRTIGPGADIYALGCTLYDIATDSLPFDAPTKLALMFKHLSEAPPSLTRVLAASGEVEQFDDVLQRCLAKVPDERYPNAGALYDALGALTLSDAPAPKRTLSAPAHSPGAAALAATVEQDLPGFTGGTAAVGSVATAPSAPAQAAPGPAAAPTTAPLGAAAPPSSATRTRPLWWIFAGLAGALVAYLLIDAIAGGGAAEAPAFETPPSETAVMAASLTTS